MELLGNVSDDERMIYSLRNFKNDLLALQGRDKRGLSRLYSDTVLESLDSIGTERTYWYKDTAFWFQGTGRRNAERLIMMIALPIEASKEEAIPVTTYLHNRISRVIHAWSDENKNDNKTREKAQIFVQDPGHRMLWRSGLSYDEDKNKYVLRLQFIVPLINGLYVNSKVAYRAVDQILKRIDEVMMEIEEERLKDFIDTYRHQQEIRLFLKENNYCAFIANGSILPREKDGEEPMVGAIKFVSAKENEITIKCEDGTMIVGMGIPRGVTVITGGGYSGKSTLLDALEAGIYDHIPGDGREYVLADRSALKVYAEDGRPVSKLDLSPFFRFLPGESTHAFSTDRASGSVSQASSILEAVCGGTGLLLIDEDKSATNFMIRDSVMKILVEDEPIIPFTDRVKQLWKEKEVSTILVIGGSSEYLKLADQVILMKDYEPCMITDQVRDLLEEMDVYEPKGKQGCDRKFHDKSDSTELGSAAWTDSRRLNVKDCNQAFLFFRSVETENEKKIILDEYSADVTMLTALTSHEQLCTLTVIMERLLTDPEGKNKEILENVQTFLDDFLKKGKTGSIMPETISWFYEEIRPLDALCCINRMRGASFV